MVDYKPTKAQKEFFERETDVFPTSTYVHGSARGALSWDVFRRFMMIDKPYAYHKPSSSGLEAINRLRELFSQVDRTIQEVCPHSRERSVALTKNEETAMWAIKSVVFNDPNSEVDPS